MSRAGKGGGAAKGWFWVPEKDEFVKGWIEWDAEGLVRSSGTGPPPEDLEINYRGVILPPLVNWHTHVGDGLFRERLAGIDRRPELAELVGPGGLKEKWLAEASSDELLRAVGVSLEELATAGCGSFCDFREGGLAGLELLERAQIGRASGRERG